MNGVVVKHKPKQEQQMQPASNYPFLNRYKMKNIEIYTIVSQFKDVEIDLAENTGFYQNCDFAIDFTFEGYLSKITRERCCGLDCESVSDVLIGKVTEYRFTQDDVDIELNPYQKHFISSWLHRQLKDYPVSEVVV